jgi:hypothetical protein
MDRSRGPRQSGRRAVLDDARRKVERALFVAAAADELARAAEDVLEEHPDHGALRAALTRYRNARDG